MRHGVTPEPQRSQLIKAVEVKADGDARVRAAVLAANEAGGSVRDIAELTGYSTNTIQRWLKEK